MKRFDKSQYALGADGLYRRKVQFGDAVETIVRDERGDMVRIDKTAKPTKTK